jgi:hypothetical protein
MDKEKLKQQKTQLLNLTSEFCRNKLDKEHEELTRKLVYKLYRNNGLIPEPHKLNEWAASIIHAIGSVNLLFDHSFRPYLSEKELIEYFNTKLEAITPKSEKIKERLNLNIFDSEFSTHVENEDNPLKDMISIDGIYISIDLLPAYLQEKFREMKNEGYQIEFRSDEI